MIGAMSLYWHIASFSLPRSNSVAFGLKQTLGRIL
jgi:hypothetical protein